MQNEMILNKSQAKAVYSAMCALNNVNGRIKVSFGETLIAGINVIETESEDVHVICYSNFGVIESEKYVTRDHFAIAYELIPKDLAPSN